MPEVEHNVTDKTRQLLQNWTRSKNVVEKLELQLKEAERVLESAKSDLGTFLTPQDAGFGEPFNLWFADGLIDVRKDHQVADGKYTFRIVWRKLPSMKALNSLQ